jgi:hypothetical protein
MYNRTRIMEKDEDWIDVDPVVPDWTCASITAGRRFENMTYSQMFDEVQKLHVSNGGVHLCVHSRPFKTVQGGLDELPISVEFYCPHSRDHGDQCGDKKMDEVRFILRQEHPNHCGLEAQLIDQEVPPKASDHVRLKRHPAPNKQRQKNQQRMRTKDMKRTLQSRSCVSTVPKKDGSLKFILLRDLNMNDGS